MKPMTPAMRLKALNMFRGFTKAASEYLRDKEGSVVIKDGVPVQLKGSPIQIKAEERQVPANVGMLIWLGKQWLGQRETPVEVPIEKDSSRTVYKIQWGGTEESQGHQYTVQDT